MSTLNSQQINNLRNSSSVDELFEKLNKVSIFFPIIFLRFSLNLYYNLP